MNTVYVLYVVADTAESNVEIYGVYSTKEKAETKREEIRKCLAKLSYRRFVSVLIDECELDV